MTFLDGLPEELVKKIKLEDLEVAFSTALAELSGGDVKAVECRVSRLELIEDVMRGSIKMELKFSSPMTGDIFDFESGAPKD